MAAARPLDERRLFEHFVVAGLKGDAEHVSPSAQECGCRNTQPLAPITDICVIFPGMGETVPEGFEMIENTPLGYPADLNHGSLRVASCFLCFRRGYHKPPLIDVGVLDQGRGEKPMLDSNTLQTTPFGRPANVNNASQGVFLTYRRAPANSAPSQLVVTHICVILANKGEIPPHTYYKITKNLNKGIVGSDVYICYKKSLGSAKRLAYKPAILDYFPKKPENAEDNEEINLLANVPLFCLPMGALIECWPAKCQRPERQFSTFVLTDEFNRKYYGAAVTFYERYRGQLSEEQLEKLEVDGADGNKEGGAVEDSASTNDPAEHLSFHTNVSICLVSRYPFFNAFKRFLFYIHRMSQTMGSVHSVPIERYISHLMYEVSFPTPRRPRVLMQLGAETISFDSHDDSQLPLNGAALFDTLKCLGPDNLMYLMLLAMLEQKILIHSLRPWLLTAVAESMCALMFPFHWQCPYVPQCPLSLAGVLHAPLPFIAGVDSRYFDLYEDPPSDVTCFDLDTATISWSTVRQQVKLSLFPKKPAKQLKNSLEMLYRKLQAADFNVVQMQNKADFVPVDVDFQLQMKRRVIEIGIHEAFLRFTSSLMRGYQSFLRPIVSAPQSQSATDTGNLFDLDGFLRTRDKAANDFFKRFSSTQSFIRFIEERSFVSDKNAYNAFFDDCITKVDMSDDRDVSLLDVDTSLNSNHTVFIAPPEPLTDPATGNEREFVYKDGFPRHLDPSLFQLDKLNVEHSQETSVPIEHEMGRCAGVRTKPEIRSSLLAATNSVRTQPLAWPKTLLFYGYSLWFMQLPSMLAISTNKRKVLHMAFHILDRLESTEIFPLDQVCYRILIELCGQCGEPALAVKVLHVMRRTGLEQNAVTYGIYHRAVMNAEWPPEKRMNAVGVWRRLRLRILGMTQFRNGRVFTGTPVDGLATSLDTVSVSDNGYHSDRPAETEQRMPHPTVRVQIGDDEFDDDDTEDDRLSTEPFIISHAPLDGGSTVRAHSAQPETVNATRQQHIGDANVAGRSVRSTSVPCDGDPLRMGEDDPLGALGGEKERGEQTARANATMSPSRAKFMEDHGDRKLFAEETPKAEKEKKSGGGWLRGLTNSPIIKMIRSSTMENMDRKSSSDGASDSGSGLTVSPSLHSLVTQVRKGYDEVLKDGNVSRFRLGVSSFVQEVKSLNKSYGAMGSGQLFGDDSDDLPSIDLNTADPAYQLESGTTGSLLTENWWCRGVFPEEEEGAESSSSSDRILEVNLCTCTVCPHCKVVIYDEEIMAGWKVEDQNLNTECPFCCAGSLDSRGQPTAGVFAPRLHVSFKWKSDCRTSWYTPSDGTTKGTQEASSTNGETSVEPEETPSPLSVAFISPLVLRRELETLVAQDILALKERSLMESHPVVYWNLVYYLRRLSLPSHLLTWIGAGTRTHIRCVYDRPDIHTDAPPLYLNNPNISEIAPSALLNARSTTILKQVTGAVEESNMFKAIQALVNECRRVNDNKVTLTKHFPIFRDIQFASLDAFGRALNRSNVDEAYQKEYERLPPRILPLLPVQDYPPTTSIRASRMVFLPLDLF